MEASGNVKSSQDLIKALSPPPCPCCSIRGTITVVSFRILPGCARDVWSHRSDQFASSTHVQFYHVIGNKTKSWRRHRHSVRALQTPDRPHGHGSRKKPTTHFPGGGRATTASSFQRFLVHNPWQKDEIKVPIIDAVTE